MTKAFASQADLAEKKVSFERLSENAYAYTAEGDPNTGVIIGDDAVMVIDTSATPVMAQDIMKKIREVTDLPVRYVLLTHYHAVRVLGASGYQAHGLQHIIASEDTRDLIVERGQQDMDSEIGRFPRLFRSVDSIPGLTWPTMTFTGCMKLWLGTLEVHIMQLGPGHTKGDTVAWLPAQRILYSGDLVEYDATPYTGDAHLREWPNTLDKVKALEPEQLVPGRGPALTNRKMVEDGLSGTRAFISQLYQSVAQGRGQGHSLDQIYRDTYAVLQPQFGHWVIFDHCLPFDVARAYDEAGGLDHPRIWTAERDQEMWAALEKAQP